MPLSASLIMHMTKHAFWLQIYSSALLHRGEGNTTDTSRPIMVFRYDAPTLPAPGVGVVGSQLMAFMGTLMARH